MREKARPSEQEIEVHRQWLGLLQPVGLVVSPPALNRASYIPEKSVVPLQQRLVECVQRPGPRDPVDAKAHAPDLLKFVETVLGWDRKDLRGPDCGGALPEGLEVHLETYGETLRPDFAAVDPLDQKHYLLLLQTLPRGTKLDDAPEGGERSGWHASPHAKFERLLAGSGVRVGLLFNGDDLRLVYTPEHQTSGHLTFPIHAMTEVGGRPILAALEMLLRRAHVFEAPVGKSLHEVLVESRNYQNEVSNVLAEQVLGALWELLRGFQAADRLREGKLLVAETPEDREHLYGGLLTALMRTVFLLYAEDQDLLPRDKVWVENYSIAGLHRRLRDDAALYPDTMDQRFGAWAALLALCRLVHRGGGHGELRLPPRKGSLFNPDAFPFLEGRARGSVHDPAAPIEAPRVSDGCIFEVLKRLLVLDGERLSYRALDVEQIGSVYEAMMGYSVERMAGASLAVKVPRKGIPGFVFVDVERLLAQPGKDRAKWLKSEGCDLAPGAAAALKGAGSADEVLAALDRRVSTLTPRVLPPGTLVLQPGEERRRSGSHYTPRELTQPIVATTLRPVLEGLGANPTPAQILNLKVCDPAMGSGAFLVEACRQLADRLVEAWDRHKQTPEIPADEYAHLHARRLIAQRCLYGVDKNPYAVDLAKLSLWLVTLARDHPFTFIDHALKIGDSLVGLTRAQIQAFHWDTGEGRPTPLLADVKGRIETARSLRLSIGEMGDRDEDEKRVRLARAEGDLARARLAGDLVVTAFFAADKGTDREQALRLSADHLEHALREDSPIARHSSAAGGIHDTTKALIAFHWEIEFPEVFGRDTPGFDAIVGNPPFMGGRRISEVCGSRYVDFLLMRAEGTSGGVDLVAHFFRRAFDHLRKGAAFGLIATNTIGQGDTRAGGLRWICHHDGQVYSATRRVKWPGTAAVVVSVVHVLKGRWTSHLMLDGREVPTISAYLFHGGSHDDPARFTSNQGLAFQGTIILGMGFTFDDAGKTDATTPLAEMRSLIRKDRRNQDRIVPFLGGEEVNESPTHAPRRFVIDFGEMDEPAARQWPDLFGILERRVRPERAEKDARKYPRMVLEWWKFWNPRVELYRMIQGLDRVIAVSRYGQYCAFTMLPAGFVYSDSLIVVADSGFAAYCALQSRSHEVWARFFGSTMKDDLRYTPSDVFETFPFPEKWREHPALDAAGQEYIEHRERVMVERNEGLTKTYHRFHDPEERAKDIVCLRELHAAMDRVVLDAYGWNELHPTCDFFLDYEIDEAEWGRKKKPWRYRWPDEFRDEVLGRLLELNRQRAEAERLSGPKPKRSAYPEGDKVRRMSRARKVAEGGASLFDEPREDDA